MTRTSSMKSNEVISIENGNFAWEATPPGRIELNYLHKYKVELNQVLTAGQRYDPTIKKADIRTQLSNFLD